MGDPPISIAAASGNRLPPLRVVFWRDRVALRGPILIFIPGITFPFLRIALPAPGRPAIANHRHIFPLPFPRWNSLERWMGRPYISA
jgi:hypothetical protein